jgi:NADH-quinone oxidoreductase subunit J
MITQYIFYFLSALAIAGALMTILNRNAVYSVLSLIVTFIAIAGHFFLMGSTFLASVHIIVYLGAIMVLFLYVIMMMNLNQDTEPNKSILSQIGAAISGGCLLLILVVALKDTEKMQMAMQPNVNIGDIERLGYVLYTQYLLPFEVSSVLFLVGMVGAVMLGKKEIQ